MNVLRFPADESIFARLTEQQRLANIAAENAEIVQTARAILRAPEHYTDDQLIDACIAMQRWGDGYDHLTADAMIDAIRRRERIARNIAAQTPTEVVMQHRDRWPVILFWGAVVATALLAATGWLG